MKRILMIATLLLAVVALLAGCGKNNKANSALTNKPSERLVYIVDKKEGAVTIKGRGLYTSTDIVIPSELEGYPVLYNADRAFQDDMNLKSIAIPNSVTSIGDYAFFDCSRLTSVTIGNSVTNIGNYAFYYCSGLTDIDYQGTEAEWIAISKGVWWNYNTGSYTIHYTA